MNCPICGSELVQGDRKRFEDLCDHVSNPNATSHPLRPTYICSEIACVLTPNLLWWDEMGDLYIEDYDLYHSFRDRLKPLCTDKILEAHNSFAKKLRMQARYNDKYNKLLSIGNFKWELKRRHECDEAGTIIKKRYYIQTFKKDGHGYTYYSGFWRMLIYVIRRFNRTIKHYKLHHDEWSTKEIKNEFKALEKWQQKDNYRKVFKWYINTFYRQLKGDLK